jgi:quercetin dioxygenase-like cupin family protein
MSAVRHGATALAAAFLLGACGDESVDGGADDRGAGVGGLGGSARVDTLARAALTASPPGEAAWIADEVRLEAGDTIGHSHELAFAYSRRGSPTLRADGVERSIPEGGGAAVQAGSRHVHAAGETSAVLWEIRLARAGAAPASGMRKASRVFESEPLEGIPVPAEASFLSVTVPPRGGRTTVHTHPGPELIYQLSGRIDYQNGLIGTKRLGPGDLEGIPPGTAVQKRNPFSRPAVFLSWFLVDPDRPFAPKASFR